MPAIAKTYRVRLFGNGMAQIDFQTLDGRTLEIALPFRACRELAKSVKAMADTPAGKAMAHNQWTAIRHPISPGINGSFAVAAAPELQQTQITLSLKEAFEVELSLPESDVRALIADLQRSLELLAESTPTRN